MHAIGDRANGIVLDAFEASLQGVNVTASRPRLEHAQFMTGSDMKRLGRLGGMIVIFDRTFPIFITLSSYCQCPAYSCVSKFWTGTRDPFKLLSPM